MAMNKLLEESDIKIFANDNAHPSRACSYLQACIYYFTIFRERIASNNFTGGLSGTDVRYLQETASDIVIENLSFWNNID